MDRQFQLQRPIVDPAVQHRAPRPAATLDAGARNRKWCRFWLMVYRNYVRHAPPNTAVSATRLMQYPRHTGTGQCNHQTCTFVVHDDYPVYVCVSTGMVHICSASCDRLEYLQHYNVKRCPVSGREFPADYDDDDAHNRATKRTTSTMDMDVQQLYASSTVRGWKRQEQDALFAEQCLRVQQINALFPSFPPTPRDTTPPTPDPHHTECSSSASSPRRGRGPYQPRVRPRVSASASASAFAAASASAPASAPATPSGQSQHNGVSVVSGASSAPVVRKRVISRVAKASLVHQPGTREIVSTTWKSVLQEFYPGTAYTTAIRQAYLTCVHANFASSADIPLFGHADDLNAMVEARVAQQKLNAVFAWLFEFLWFTWVAIVDTKRYQQNQFSYQPDNHATAVIRYLGTGYQHNARQVVPRIRWFGEHAVDIKVRSHDTDHTRTHTVRRNLTRSTALFMRLWNEVPDSHLQRLPFVNKSLHPFF